jgi:phytoene synthase
MDLDHARYETFDDLREYCWRVASTVGFICLNIFGCRHPGAREYALNLGLALQLTNIVRDVKVDLERGRVYLPQDEMRRFQCTEDHLRAGVATGEVRALLAHQLARARTYYEQASAALPVGEARRLVAAEIMGAIYFGILRRIEARGYDVFSEVVRVSRPQRAWIAATTWARTLMRAGVEALTPARTP